MTLSRRSLCPVAALFLASRALLAGGPAWAQDIPPGLEAPPAGSYGQAVRVAPSALGPAYEYRFSETSPWLALDRPLILDAFPGEDRAYRLYLRDAAKASFSLSYRVDRRPPPTPLLLPAAADQKGKLTIRAESPGRVMLSVDGLAFAEYDARLPPERSALSGSMTEVYASAYSVDDFGNASPLARASWRLSPEGFTPSFPASPSQDAEAAKPAAGVSLSAAHDPARGLVLDMTVPAGASPLVAVWTDGAQPGPEAYTELGARADGVARLIVPLPFGYAARCAIGLGYRLNGHSYTGLATASVSPAYPAGQALAAVQPPQPLETRLPGISLLSWPLSSWTIYLATAEGGFKPYERPLSYDYQNPADIQWYALDSAGYQSPVYRYQVRPLPPGAQSLATGADEGGRYGSTVFLRPLGSLSVRVSVAEGGALPPPVRSDSPLLSAGMGFYGNAGTETDYAVRMVAFDAAGKPGAERILRFTVDRKPPAVPSLSASPQAGEDGAIRLSFMPQDGRIYVSTSKDGVVSFQPYAGAVELSAPADGSARWLVRAYAEDEAGNRSPEMRPAEFILDRTAVYADPAGRPGALGSPDDPLPALEDALALALASGRNIIKLRGNLSVRLPLELGSDLTIEGGYDGRWERSESARSTLSWNKAHARPLLDGKGHALNLKGLRIEAVLSGAAVILSSEGGGLGLEDVDISLSGGLDVSAVRARDCAVNVRNVSLTFRDMFTARGFDLSACVAQLGDLSMDCQGSVRLFEGLRANGGRLSVMALRLEARPAQTFSGLALVNAQADCFGSAFLVSGGSSSCRLFSAQGGSLTVASVYAAVDWNGELTLALGRGGAVMRMAHLSARLTAKGLCVLDTDAPGSLLCNSILNAVSSRAVLVRSQAALEAGSISANCLWGFSTYLEGAAASEAQASPPEARLEARLEALNRWALPAYPNFNEAPEETFAQILKGVPRLSPDSACVDAGMPLTWAVSFDMDGNPKPSDYGLRKPDIGADEIQ